MYYYSNEFTTSGKLNITPPDFGIKVGVLVENMGAATVTVQLLDQGNAETIFFKLVSNQGVILDYVKAEIVQNISVDVAGDLVISLYEEFNIEGK